MLKCDDNRKQWFSDRILKFLGENNEQLLNSLLNQSDNDGNSLDKLLAENIDSNIYSKILIIYKTFYTTIVEEEILSQEEEPKERSSLFSVQDERKGKKGRFKKKSKKSDRIEVDEADLHASEIVDEDNAEEYSVAEGKKKGSKKKKKIFKRDGRSSPSTMMENIQDERGEKSQTVSSSVGVKKSIQKVIEMPQIHHKFGKIENQDLNPENHYIYFIKKINGSIPTFDDVQQAYENMPSFFIVGSIPGNLLNSLNIILENVYSPLFKIPLLDKMETITEIESLAQILENENCNDNSLRKPSEFFIKKNFVDQSESLESSEDGRELKQQNEFLLMQNTLKWAVKEMEGNRSQLLSIPTCFHKYFQGIDFEDENIKNEIVESLFNWNETLNSYENTLQEGMSSFSLILTTTSKEDLLSEYFYWKKHQMKTAEILDVLEHICVKKLLTELENQKEFADLCCNIHNKKETLQKNWNKLVERAEELQILTPFFKAFMNDDFGSVRNIIPKFIECLRSIWVLSTYYNKEENMLRILLNVKTTLCNRVKNEFEVTHVFKQDWNNLKEKLAKTSKMLQIWKTSYLENRHCIETNPEFFIPRWEFNKSDLFSETEYITSVIHDLKDVLKVSRQFRNIIEYSGFEKLPECTSESMNLRKNMENLTSPIEKVDFDIYLEIFHDEWQEVLDIFQHNVLELDQYLKILTIKAFSQIKSLKENIEIVKRIAKIETRSTIQDSLPYICNKIVNCFMKQITISTKMFEKQRVKNSNPYKIYDSIFPTENLLRSLNHQINNLRCMMETASLTSAVYEEAIANYENLKSRLEQSLETTVKNWCSDVIYMMNMTLHECIIEVQYTKSPRGYSATKKLTNDRWENPNVKDQLLLIEKDSVFKIKMKQEIFDIFVSYDKVPKNFFQNEENFSSLSHTLESLREKVSLVNTAVARYNNIIQNLPPEQEGHIFFIFLK